MADYISTLTGVQMDSALIDMAEHTSEAYAIGERNGVPVDSSDVAYHNNARYYAQQAQSIAPASVTEAVRWDIAQTALTDAQRLQARENIEATSHNYNLLDNSWFTVNSRNITTGTGSTANSYLVDRWNYSYGSGGCSWTWNANGITIAPTNTSSHALLKQKLLSDASLDGKVVTGSVMLQDGTIYSGTINYIASNPSAQYFFNVSLSGDVSFRFFIDNPTKYVVMDMYYGAVAVRAAKVEIGSFSTLAQDTPPDYGEELTRCIYSTADPTDTYANNGFGRTNPNLLDNPFFTINQRGQSSYTAQGYTVDRWVVPTGCTVTVNSDNTVRFQEVAGQTYRSFRQTLEKPSYYANGTYTVSIWVSSISVAPYFIVYDGDSNELLRAPLSGTGIKSFTITTDSSGISAVLIACLTVQNVDITIKAMKLEKGTVSTLANDTPPDYGTELAKCQRYFVRVKGTYAYVGTGVAVSTTLASIVCPLPVPMRALPTATVAGSLYLHSNADVLTTGFTPVTLSNNMLTLNATVSSGLSVGYSEMAQIRDGSSYVDLSADL